MWTDGGTDITKLTVDLNSCFAKAPENKRVMDYVRNIYFIFYHIFQTAKPHSP